MNTEYIDLIKEKTEKLIAVPHCYQALKEIGRKWIESIGSSEEKETAKKFIEELKEDVLSVDQLIEFSTSDFAKEKFGEDAVKKMHDGAVEAKAKGGKYCTCAACQLGGEILDLSEYLLK